MASLGPAASMGAVPLLHAERRGEELPVKLLQNLAGYLVGPKLRVHIM